MKPTSIFTFRQNPVAPTRYILTKHRGLPIAGFPATYLRGSYKGEAYIGFRATVVSKPGHRRFTHTIEIDKGQTVTGVNFYPATPGKTYGDFGNDALLIEIGDGGKHLTIWFFKDRKAAAETLYGKWTSGELPDVASVDVAPLPGVDVKKSGGCNSRI